MIVPDLIKAVEAGQEKARLEIQRKHRMNKRIKELAEQASHQSPDGYPVTIPYSKDFAEKFAELIMKECIEVASKQKNPHNLNYKPSERFVEDLKLHFGVEE